MIIMGVLSGIVGGLLKAIVFLLRTAVVASGIFAVLFIVLSLLKLCVGALAKVLGVNGGGGGGGAISGPIGNLLGTAVGAVDRAVNGVFNGVGTVFGGVTNTAGMVRDKVLGRNSGYKEDRARRGRYRDNYYENEGNYNYRKENRRHNQREVPINYGDNGKVLVGDPNNPEDPYFNQKRYYDEYGYDQFGYNKDGEHKDDKFKEYLEKSKKSSVKDLLGEKTIADNEVVDRWIRNTEFSKPKTWAFGAAGMTYAAAHSLGKIMNLKTPEEWENDDVIDSGIKTYDITQEDIDEAEERKERIRNGEEEASKGINKNSIIDFLRNKNPEEQIEVDDNILEEERQIINEEKDDLFGDFEVENAPEQEEDVLNYDEYMKNEDSSEPEMDYYNFNWNLNKETDKEKVPVESEKSVEEVLFEKEMEIPENTK